MSCPLKTSFVSFFCCHIPEPAKSSLNSRCIDKRVKCMASGCEFGNKVTCCQTVRSGISCSTVMVDIQSLSMSSESFNPGQTQQAHQRECASEERLRNMTMDGRDTGTDGNATALLASGGEVRYSFCSMVP